MQFATNHPASGTFRSASLRQVVLQRLKQKWDLFLKLVEAYGELRAAQQLPMMESWGVSFKSRRP